MVRLFALALVACCYLQPEIALTQDAAKQLVGTWKLTSAPSVRKPLRYAAYVLLICLSLILLPAGLLLLFDTRQLIWTDRFYVERPILHAMRLVHDGVWSNDSEPARSVLLQHVPVGTDPESAVAALSKESFDCKTSRWPSDENNRKLRGLEQVQMSGALLNCQLLAPERLGYTRWLIDLRFDEGKRLLGVKVAIWNIFL